MKKLTQISILVCEDDPTVASLITEHLREQGYSVRLAVDGQEGLEAVLSGAYDLCLTDIAMPKMNGLEMISEVRKSGRTLPIIVVSVRASREDMIAGYQAGCDDYVAKPFSMDILVYKIQAILRRIKQLNEDCQTTFQLGSLVFDSVHQTLNGQKLTGRESGLLLLLCQKQNQIVERSLILRSLWAADNYFASRSLSVYINRLRTYLKADASVRIAAIHGKGYKLVTSSEQE